MIQISKELEENTDICYNKINGCTNLRGELTGGARIAFCSDDCWKRFNNIDANRQIVEGKRKKNLGEWINEFKARSQQGKVVE